MKHSIYINHGNEDLSNTLWQYIAKRHMEEMVGYKIKKKDWTAFIDDVCETFCDSVSRKAKNYWDDWKEHERNNN